MPWDVSEVNRGGMWKRRDYGWSRSLICNGPSLELYETVTLVKNIKSKIQGGPSM